MKALIADGKWRPANGYLPSEQESRLKRALVGSRVWKDTFFEIKDVPIPEVRNDEVLIKVNACGICGSDTHEKNSEGYIIFSGLTKLPCVIGHEFAGVVVETGSGVQCFKEGDRVAVESIMWCGVCHCCRSGNPNQCKNIELLGLSRDGALAEYVAVSERFCWDISPLADVCNEDELFEIGALIEPIGCAYNGIFVAGGGFAPGAIVAVYGAGPIGLGAVALARTAGASRVIAFDVVDARLDVAKRLGADFAFNINGLNGRCAEKVMELTKGWGADIQVEAAGAAPVTIPEMEKSLAAQGKIIYLGRAATSTAANLDGLVTGANSIIGARGHAGYGIFPNIIKLIGSGRLKVGGMITSKYRFQDALDAIGASAMRKDAKIIVKF